MLRKRLRRAGWPAITPILTVFRMRRARTTQIFLCVVAPARAGLSSGKIIRPSVEGPRHSSTNDFSRDKAWSHCSETKSRYCLIPSSGCGSNSNRRSRPLRTLRTIPTLSNTRRCLVIACRVSLEPRVSWEIEQGRPPQSFATSASRVSSPSAANTGARVCRLAAMRLRLFCDMLLDVLHLLCPTAVVHAECFVATVAGDFVKARLREHKQGAACGLLQPEFDKGGRFLGIIYFGIDAIRMPRERKKPFGLHFLHDGLPFQVLVAMIGNLAA